MPTPDPPDEGTPTRMATNLVMATVFFALSRGVPLEAITEATGLSADALQGATAWLPQDVVPKVWLLLAERFPDEAIALTMARLAPPERVFGELGRAGNLAPDLRTMIRLFVRNSALLSDELDLQLIEGESEARVQWTHPMDAVDGGYGAELAAGLTVRTFAERFGREGLLSRVEFCHQRKAPESTYTEFFGVPVHFECPANAVVFPAAALDRANPGADPSLQLFIQRHLDRVREQLGARPDSPILLRIREAVTANAARGLFTSQALAKELGMSQRVLQRQLRDAGTSARDLLEEARKAYAFELLRNPGLSVDEIASLLGYTTERSFRRAFERWTGQTPSQARREALTPDGR